MRFPRETYWQGAPYIGTAANGGFTSSELTGNGERYLHHAVHIRADGKVGLARDNERIDGFFVMFDGSSNPMVIYRDSSKGSYARNAGTTAIAEGARLVGAEKTDDAVTGSHPQCGYVKAFSDGGYIPSSGTGALPGTWSATTARTAINTAIAGAINNAIYVCGNNIVRNGGTGSTAATYPPADVVVEHGIATDAGN